ncbi:MAG: glycosyltransferase family 39 protein [Bacteroidales bacterium]|jgi:uncharacterized membrane protein
MIEKRAFLVKISPLALIILNIVIKIMYISTNSIGGDEPFSIYYAQMDIPLIISNLSPGNNPPLYEILLYFWIKLFGIGPLAVRLPSLIFSSATVYFIYRIGKDFFNYQIALLAGLLFTLSNFHIFFAHEARVYPLFALLTTMSMYYFLKICHNRTVFRSYILLLVVSILMLYAHYFSLFVLIIQILIILFDVETRRKQLRNYLLFLLCLIVLFSPYLFILYHRFIDSSQNGTWLSQPNGVEAIYNMLWSFSNSPVTTVVSIGILLAALVKAIIKKDFVHLPVGNKLVVIWFIFPFLTMFTVSFWIPMFIGRYLIFLSIGYYLLLAMSSIYLVKNKRYQLVIPGILLMLFVFTIKLNVGNKRHVKETIAKIVELKDENTVVLVCPQFFDLNFTYYYDPEIFKEANQPNALTKLHEKMKKKDVNFVYSVNDVTIDNTKKVLYLDVAAQSSYPNNNILPTLEQSHQLANTYRFYEIFTLYEFQNKH